MVNKLDKNFSPVQAAVNIASNYAVFIFGILLSLWYTPFLIRNLGAELFGFIPLATSVTNLLGIITQSFHLANRRHVTVELEKGNLYQANQIFSASFFGTLLLISAAAPIGLLLVIFAAHLFNAPLNHERDVQLLFLGTVIAYFISTLEVTFSVASYARNRFDLWNIVKFTSRISQIAIVVIFFKSGNPRLLYVGYGIGLAAIISVSGDVYLWKKLLPDLKLQIRSFENKFLNLLVDTSIWLFIYQVGSILFVNLDMLVANRVLGLGLAGMYGALLVIPKNLRVMSNTTGGVWGPTILSRYGKGDFIGIDRVVRTASKIIGLSLALPIGYLLGTARPFLGLWLGLKFEPMSWVLVAMIFHLSSNLIISPFFNVQLALQKIKLPAVVNISSGLAYGLLAVLLAQRYGPLGIAIAGALVMTIKNLLFMPIYTARIMGMAWWHYLIVLLAILVWTLGVALASYFIGVFLPVQALFNFVLNGALISFGYLLAIILIGLTREEKALAVRLLRQFSVQSIPET